MRAYKFKLLTDSIKQAMLIQLEQRDILFAFNGDAVIFSCSPMDRAVVLMESKAHLGGDKANALSRVVTNEDHQLLADKTNVKFI